MLRHPRRRVDCCQVLAAVAMPVMPLPPIRHHPRRLQWIRTVDRMEPPIRGIHHRRRRRRLRRKKTKAVAVRGFPLVVADRRKIYIKKTCAYTKSKEKMRWPFASPWMREIKFRVAQALFFSIRIDGNSQSAHVHLSVRLSQLRTYELFFKASTT